MLIGIFGGLFGILNMTSYEMLNSISLLHCANYGISNLNLW